MTLIKNGNIFPIMNKPLSKTLYAILTPLLRICFRKGMAFGEFSQVLKRAYIDVAEQELLAAGDKATTSRIAVVTGLTRKDVGQLRKEPSPKSETSQRYNRISRVLSGWMNDKNFCDADGAPKALKRSDDPDSFDKLVERYSGDMVARAVLEELIRVGAVEKTANDEIRLLQDTFLSGEDEEEGLSILGTDTALLIDTINHNLTQDQDNRRFQRKVSYDNLPEECIPAFKELASKESYQLLVKLNKWLAEHDRDSNPNIKGTGRVRSGIGIYYFEEDAVEKGAKDDL